MHTLLWKYLNYALMMLTQILKLILSITFCLLIYISLSFIKNAYEKGIQRGIKILFWFNLLA